MLTKFLRVLQWLGLGILVVIGLGLGTAYLVYPAEFVNRVLRWGESDVYDYQKFPERVLEPSDQPFGFGYDLQEDEVREVFEQGSGSVLFEHQPEKGCELGAWVAL